MKVKQSNPTVIEIQTNTLDEKQIRKRFETLGYEEEVYLVLLIDRQSDKEEKDVGKEEDDTIVDGVYDVTTQEEDDSLVITDLSQYLKPELSIDEERFPSSTFVIKCNLCNYSFVSDGLSRDGSISQVRQHNRSEDHNRKLATRGCYKLEQEQTTDQNISALINCVGELMRKYRDKIKKILIDRSSGENYQLEIQLLTLLLPS